MRFSILVPVYNVRPYLKDCIDSVLRQSFSDWELILVDDGADDGSEVLCDEAAKAHPDRIRVLHQQNRGLIAARRAGIPLAKGEICLFLDADDDLEPQTLATLEETFQNTGADLVIFNYVDVYEQTGAERPAAPVFTDGRVFSGPDKELLYGELIRGWRLNNLCTKAIRTGLLTGDPTDYTPYYGNPHTEDLLQSLYPMTAAKTVAYRSAPLYRYRRRADSISAKALSGQIGRQLNVPVMELLRDYLTTWGMDTKSWRRAYYTRRFFALISLFWQHYRGAASRAERRAVVDYPWESHLSEESRNYLKDNDLGLGKRMQLQAILRKDRCMLAAFAFLGGLRMRARHGA